MAFKKGVDAIRESIQRSQTKSNPRNYDKANWFYWTPGESKAIRFLTDVSGIFVVAVHDQVPTVDGGKKTFVCRTEFGEDCELCAREKGTPGAYRRDVGFGIAVLREEVYEEVDGQRKLVGYRDVTSTYEETVDGKTITKKKPYVGIVKGGMRNFWGQLSVISEKYGNLRDREIEIMRQGKGTDTTYMAFALDKKIIENIDERYSKFIPELEVFLNRIGSKEYYDAQLHGIVKEKATAETAPISKVATSYSDDEYGEDEYVSIPEETTAERLARKMNQQ